MTKEAYNTLIMSAVKPAQSFNAKGNSMALQPEGGKTKFKQTLKAHLSVADQIKEHNAEKRATWNQVAQMIRTESDERRRQLMALWLQKDEKKEPEDVYAKCIAIARRIMRGEKVSIEDMRLIAQHYPQLLFQALLLRQEDNDDDERDEDADEDGKFSDYAPTAIAVGGAASKPVAPAAPETSTAAE